MEEMFQTNISWGSLYYGMNRRRSRVEFTEDLRSATKETAKKMHEMFKRGHTPNVKTSKRCKSCSLADLCLPKLQKSMDVGQYIRQNIHTGD